MLAEKVLNRYLVAGFLGFKSTVTIDPKKDWDGWVKAKVEELNRFFKAKGKYLGSGRNRAVYQLRKDYVIKVPINEDGFADNFNEDRAYHRRRNEPLAAARMVYADKSDGIPLLVMEYVEPVKSFKDLPSWVYSIDSMQVGYNRKGKLVAYDYGDWF
jgi:hypothetical protein